VSKGGVPDSEAAGRTLRLVLVVTVLAALLVQGAAALAVPGPRDVAQLTARAKEVQAQLDAQYAAIERLTEQLNETTDRQAGLERQLQGLRRQQGEVQADLAKAQGQLDAQVRAAYMAGPAYVVGELVGSPDLAEALNRLPLQRSVLEAHAATLDHVRQAKASLDSVKAQISGALAEQQRLAARLTAQRAGLKTLTDQLETTLHQMDAELAGALTNAQRLDESARRAAFQAFAAGAHGSLGSAYYQAGAAAQRAVQFALAHLGDPYLWGATGPSRFDCSGLTWAAYRAAGVAIPRVARAQWGAGPHLDVASLIPGDLVFFADDVTNPATIHHVGMYIGGGLMIHAPHTGAVVSVASVWRSGYIGAVRVVPANPKPGTSPPPTFVIPPGTTPPPPSMTTRPPTTTPPKTTTPRTTSPPTTRPPTTTRAPTTTKPPTTTGAPTTTAGAATTARAPTTTTRAATSAGAPGEPPTTAGSAP
jgi:cell wall-associated NlpC family hydrolase